MRKIKEKIKTIFRRIYYNSSLHVFYYKALISNDHSIIWTACCIGSIGLAIWSIYSAILSFMDNRPIMSIVTQNFPYEYVVFPCVSICNFNKVSRKEFKIIDDILINNNISRANIDNFARSLQYLVSLEAFNYNNEVISNHSDIFRLLRSYNYTVDNLMFQVHPRCEKMLRKCTFQSKPFECMTLMRTIKTVEGFCCSFNYRGTIEFGDEMDGVVDESTIIRTGAEMGNGISFQINLDPNDFVSSILPSYSARVLISDPVDYAEAHIRSAVVGIKKVLNLEVRSSVVDTSPTLRSLDIQVRHCVYPEETIAGELYRYHTCVAKCKVDYVYEHCGCVPYYFPITRNQSRRICELNDLNCVRFHKREIETRVPKNEGDKIYCGCLPECEDTFYRVKSKSFYWSENFEYQELIETPELENDTIIRVFYKSNTCTLYKSQALMVWNELLASIGGTLGLCVGGSVLSVIEILYYIFFTKPKKDVKAVEPDNYSYFPFVH